MFPLGKTKRAITIISIINILLVALFGGMYYILNQQAFAAQQSATKIKNIQRNKNQTASLKKLLADTKPERKLLDSYFIQPDGAASFISKLESTAQQSDVRLQIRNVSLKKSNTSKETKDNSSKAKKKGSSEKKAIDTIADLMLDIKASGDWQDIITFVRNLENLPYIIRFQEVSFNQTPKQANNQGVWNVAITLQARKIMSP